MLSCMLRPRQATAVAPAVLQMGGERAHRKRVRAPRRALDKRHAFVLVRGRVVAARPAAAKVQQAVRHCQALPIRQRIKEVLEARLVSRGFLIDANGHARIVRVLHVNNFRNSKQMADITVARAFVGNKQGLNMLQLTYALEACLNAQTTCREAATALCCEIFGRVLCASLGPALHEHYPS